jgi:arylsulfatase A-like enzyme
MKRRTFLKNAGLTGAAVLGASVGRPTTRSSSTSGSASSAVKPNILVIIVDQLRIPRWFPNQAQLDQLLPNVAALRRRSVSFKRHYTAATACTPSRAALLTGLYTHQTAMLTTIVVGDDPNRTTGTPTEPPLNPGFPTWGTALRGMGYQSWWFGKWHLTNGDQCDLSPYGFNGGTCPSPNGFPGQGQYQDPCIVNQFSEWIATSNAAAGPWCTTVSLNNPHDIAWYFRYTECPNVNQVSPPRIIGKLPGNFETPDSLRLNKPGLQTQLWQGTAEALGLLPYSGPGFEEGWVELLNLYLLFQTYVDVQIGRVMSALAASPYAQNTVVVFTADHGEYAGSQRKSEAGDHAGDMGSQQCRTNQLTALATTLRGPDRQCDSK